MPEPLDKVLRLGEVRARCEAARLAGRTVVLANGAFDLLHVGHVRYLAAARAAGDLLVVAVNSDTSVHAIKGPLRPLVPAPERVELLAHLDVVDWIVVFDEPTVTEVLRELQPAIHAKGTDYTPETVPERDVVAAWGGRTLICGDPKDHATTDLISEIVRRFGAH